jgi:NADPH2:quinone reductase
MPSWDNVPNGAMDAAVLTKLGGKSDEAFTFVHDYPKPTLPDESWVLVRVYAAGMQRSDLRARINEYLDPREFGIFADEYQPVSPKLLGEEFVGEIVQAGARTQFQKDERVAGFVYGGGKAFDGSYGQYTICPARRCWRLGKAAESLPWETLGAIPLSMWTAYGAMFVAADTKLGDTVFIHGGSSAVGIWAILLAKDKGCTVIASTRQKSKVEKMKHAGADHVFLESELAQGAIRQVAPNGVKTVLELVGISTMVDIGLPALALHGTLVIVGVLNLVWSLKEFHPDSIPLTRKITTYTIMEEDEELSRGVLLDIVEKVKKGTFKSEDFLSQVFDLENVGQAHQYMEDDKACGKIVLRVK